jgi:hypothetical protein
MGAAHRDRRRARRSVADEKPGDGIDQYRLRATNELFNIVYPFYLQGRGALVAAPDISLDDRRFEYRRGPPAQLATDWTDLNDNDPNVRSCRCLRGWPRLSSGV